MPPIRSHSRPTYARIRSYARRPTLTMERVPKTDEPSTLAVPFFGYLRTWKLGDTLGLGFLAEGFRLEEWERS